MNQYRTLINFGALAGLSAFVAFLIYYLVDSNPLGNVEWITAWIPIVFIYQGTKRWKDDEFKGFINYGKAFAAGLIITVAYALLYGMLSYLFILLVDGGIFEAHLDEIMWVMEQARQFLGDEATDKMMEEVDKMTLFSAITGNAFNKLFGGLLISLVVAGILKKKETPFDQA